MNQEVFGAYLIVEILSKNRNDLEKYECVPSTWVKVKDNYDNTVVFGYPMEDRLVTRLRIIGYQPLDMTWPITFGEVVFDTDSQEEALQNLKRKNEHESITDQPKDSGKQDNKEVKSTTSKTIELKPINQTKKRCGRTRKQKQSDQVSNQSKESEDELKKKLELAISEARKLIRTCPSDFYDEKDVFTSTPMSSHNLQKADTNQTNPNETNNALEETPINNSDCKITKRPRRKSTRQTRNLSEEHLVISNEDFDRSNEILQTETDNVLEETHVNNGACKVIKRRKSTRQTRKLTKRYLGISDKDFDKSDQILQNDIALEETPVNNTACQVIKRRKSNRLTRNLSEGHLAILDEYFDRSDQILPNHNALEGSSVSNTASKVLKRRKCTRQTRNHSEGFLVILNEEFGKSDKIFPNKTDNALEETSANNGACKVIKRRKSTRQTRNLTERSLGISDEDFDRSNQIFPNDNALEETPVNNTACKVIKRRKSTRQTRNIAEGYLGISDEGFDRSDQMLPNETDNALEETPLNNTSCEVIKRRKSTRHTRNLPEGNFGISDEYFDRHDRILPNDNALKEKPVNNTACKVIKRRKSTRQTRNLSKGCLGILNEDFDKSDQMLLNETDNALEETQFNISACKQMTRRKSTRQTRNLSEVYLGFSDGDFDRSDDSDYTSEIVHPPLPDLPRPSGLSEPVKEKDIINMNLLNDQFYYKCNNFYVDFNESYQKSMSFLENAEDYLQNLIFTHKHKVVAKAKPSSPSPLYQQPDAISATMFSHPQPLLQERYSSSISGEDATWTVRYPEPGPGLIELMPNTGVYVSEKGLNKCKSTISETTKFTKALLAEVFTDEALRNCSFTGVSRRKISNNPKNTPKPGLDPKTRQTFLDYVLQYSLDMGWEKSNPEIIMSCIKNRLQWLHTSNTMS